MIWNKSVLLLVSLALCPAVFAEHNPLLPKPQEVRYGSGSVPVRSVRVAFASAPNDADLFAADQFRSWMRSQLGPAMSAYSGAGREDGALTVELDREGDKDEPLAIPGEQTGPNSREAYELSVSQKSVKIHARSSAGVYYGLQTIRQLVEGQGSQAALPLVEIRDWPSMAYRGTMVDISHGPLPTAQEIERQIDFLARWKGNQYYLYTENSIELSGYPLLNPGPARLSKQDVREIVAFGRQRHVDVIPNFDLYGHQHDLFRVEQYSDMSDQPHGTEFEARNPKVMPLMADWVEQFVDLFPSPFVSIGFDETFQIEAATHATGEAAKPADLFVKQLTAVANLFQNHGKRVMAYDDIVVKYPQTIPNLPKDLIAVAWYYTSEDPTYKRWLGPLVAHHIPHVVQPGITSYDDIAPDFDTTFENIDTFLAAGRNSGAMGLVNSVWADDAQLLFRMSFPGFAYGAAAPWQAAPMDRANFFSEYAHILYPPPVAPDIASALSNMTVAETHIKKLLGEQSMFGLWEDPFFPTYYKKLPEHRNDLHETRMHAEQAQAALLHAQSVGADPETVNSLLIGSELLDYAGEKFQTPLDLTAVWNTFDGKHPNAERWWNEWESQVTHYDHSYVTDLMERISDLKPSYRAEWLQEYTPYRLGSALGRWDAEYQYWRGVHEKLRHFNESTHPGDRLPPLNEVIESPRPSWASAQ